MSAQDNEQRADAVKPLDAKYLTNRHPVVYVASNGLDLQDPSESGVAKVNDALFDAMCAVHPGSVAGQGLLKIHIGEPKCDTRLNPLYAPGSVRFMEERGASGVVAGDTTVAYSGPRGHRQNPPGDASTYLELAEKHGWTDDGPAGAQFVVLDRPSTGIEGRFEFETQEEKRRLDSVRRFRDFYVAGGFLAADFVINHAHLTLHGLAGLAGCMKSIAMGCSGLRGKLMMHQSLLPHFDDELCVLCGRCVKDCPEGAMTISEEAPHPIVDPDLCIGCGECEALCAKTKGAVHMEGEDISDWQRGEQTLPLRMADYALGIMNGKWANVIHVLHMYTVTERCDCLNVRQKPMVRQGIGFLVGKNPFALDQMAGRILADALREESREVDNRLIETADTSARYVKDAYGIPVETKEEVIRL